jgi:predicted DNA-binding protein (UPF0251 family)
MRPRKCRRVECDVAADYFKPRGIPLAHLEEVELALDELEAIRLADVEGLYHEDAARRMDVSRATFGRTLEAARRKIAECIVGGKAIRINRTNEKEDGDEIVFPGKGGGGSGERCL